MQGNTDHVLSLYSGKETYIRCFFGEAISRVRGCWAADAVRGTGFGVQVWGLKVPKTCTRPRAPGNAGEYRTCGGDGPVHGAVPSGSLQRFGSVSAVRFGS